MATGAQAIERIAEAMVRTHRFVFQSARELREDGTDLWPQAAPGGGKNASHVRPHHLVNLTIALLTAETHVDAPRAVARYRDLPLRQAQPGRQILANPFDQAATLGQSLDHLVEHIEGFRSANDEKPIELVLGERVFPFAMTGYEGSPVEEYEFWSAPGNLEAPATVPQRLFKVPFTLFEVLAELWADTRDRQKSSPLSTSGSAPANAPAGNENAALPGAAPRQPRANAADGLLDLRHSISAWRERQPARSSTPDPGACHARDPTYSLGA